MKYNEFIKLVEELDLNVGKDWNCGENKITEVFNKNNVSLITISDSERFLFEINQPKFKELEEQTQVELFNLVCVYAGTSLFERNADKKYYVKLDSLYFDEEDKYVNKYKERYYFSDNKIEFENKSTFTQDEIDNFPLFLRNMIKEGYLVTIDVEGDNDEQ